MFKIIKSDKDNIQQISDELYNIFKEYNGDVVFFNIGTNKVTGDAFGPILGSILKMNNININSYGTLDDPIHAKNLISNIKEVKRKHLNSCIIATDAAIDNNVNHLFISDAPVNPRSALDNSLPSIGNYSIKYIIGNYYSNIYLGCIIKDNIINAANIIAHAIIIAYNKYHHTSYPFKYEFKSSYYNEDLYNDNVSIHAHTNSFV